MTIHLYCPLEMRILTENMFSGTNLEHGIENMKTQRTMDDEKHFQIWKQTTNFPVFQIKD
jgi:hypothetical protein